MLRLEAALVGGGWACGRRGLEVSGSPIVLAVELGERTRQRLEGVGLVVVAEGVASSSSPAPRGASSG